jgi:hypothetical protein
MNSLAPSTCQADEESAAAAGLHGADAVEPPEISGLLLSCQPVTHAEITEKLLEGGALKGAVLEAQDDSRRPKYAVFLLPSWRRGYCILHVHWPARPRLYRDLDRLLVLIRFDYGFTGTVALRRASETPGSKRYWRVKF